MSLDSSSSAIHLNLPPTSTSSSRPPTSITVHPSVIASILTHHARREEVPNAGGAAGGLQSRVMGVLMGHRSESGSEVDVRNCFGVPYQENQDKIELDIHFHQSMASLLNKTGTKESVVGWYATNPEQMNAFSAILQNHFSSETAPYPAIHLTVDTNPTVDGKGLSVKGWVSTPLGLNLRDENCVFLPVPVSVKFAESERPAMDLLTRPSNTLNPSLPPLPTLANSLSDLSTLIEQSLEYVRGVNSGKIEGDQEVGRYLLEGVGRWSKESLESNEEDEGGSGSGSGVKEGVQDTLSVGYLAELIRIQMELVGRLTLFSPGPTDQPQGGQQPQQHQQQQQQRGQGHAQVQN